MRNGFRLSVGLVSFLFLLPLISQAFANTVVAQRKPAELIVQLKERSAPLMTLSGVLNSLQQKLGEKAVLDVMPFMTDKRLIKIKLSGDHLFSQAMNTLNENSQVSRVEPNIIFRTRESGIPNDPDFSKTWGIQNLGQADSSGQIGKVGSDINVIPLWQQGFVGSRNVLVGVIDTGVQWDHPDLMANIYTNPGEADDKSANKLDDDGNGFVDDIHGYNFFTHTPNSNDDQGHGTHCAGTIGAVGNNGVGVAGVNWETSILPIKFLSSQGEGSLEGAVESINYAKLMKVHVVSASWGGTETSEFLTSAIRSLKESGIIFVAAAGNESQDNNVSPSYPANIRQENVISVAATDNNDRLASFSNFGTQSVHVAAPGVKVYSTTKGGKYATLSGTSMATPHVTGIVALLLSVHPEWDFTEIKKRLIETSDPVRNLSRKVISKGRVNVNNALSGTIPPSNEPPESAWVDVPMVVESEHPYKPKTNLAFPITVEGAKMIRVHFEKIQTEELYDWVSVAGPDGVVFEKISRLATDYTTDYVVGNTVTVRLTSDVSVNGYGFKIDKVQVIKE